jgi:hypothetical protein
MAESLDVHEVAQRVLEQMHSINERKVHLPSGQVA